MTVVVEGNEFVSVMNIKDYAGCQHEKPDPQYASKQRNEEPVADVGDELALAPPRRAGIAGPEMGQHGEYQRQHVLYGYHRGERLAEHFYDFQGEIGHSASSDQVYQRYS